MNTRNYSNTATEASLTTSIAAADTSWSLTSFAGYPAAPFTAAIERGTANEEIVLVTSVSSSTVVATRGYDGTTAKDHAAGAAFLHVVVAKDYAEANGHINAASGVHGLTGAVVGTSDAQTLTNKTLTSPTIGAPTVTGTAQLANAQLSGTLSVTGSTALAGVTTSGDATVGGALSASGTVTATGAITANGGVSVPTGQKATLADAPVVGTDAANKAYADTKASIAGDLGGTPAVPTVSSGAHHTHTSAQISDAASVATPSTVVVRDANGRAQVAEPSVDADIATKHYADAKFGAVTVVAAPGGYTGRTVWQKIGNVVAGHVKVTYTGTAFSVNAWTALVTLATGLPVVQGGGSTTLTLFPTNSTEPADFQLGLDGVGNLTIVNRWVSHTVGTNTWFEVGFAYVCN